MTYRSTNKTVYSANHDLMWCPDVWTRLWFVSTVGGAPLEVVRRSVENQKLVA